MSHKDREKANKEREAKPEPDTTKVEEISKVEVEQIVSGSEF